MTHPYRLVVFDWEGTLADPLGALVHFLWTEVNHQGWAAFSQGQVRHELLLGLPSAVRALFIGFSEQQIHAMIERAERMVSQERHKVFIFSGIKQLLQQLRAQGVHCAVASNKSQLSLEKALETSDIAHFFQTYRGVGILPPKPDPEMLLNIMNDIQIDIEDTVMIGDSFADIEMARTINVDAIAIDWYASGVWHAGKMGAKAVVNSIEQLAILLGVQLSSGDKIEQDV